jgi:hypothetical protein
MASERNQYKSRRRLPKKIAPTAGISKMVDKIREALEEWISAGEQSGDDIIDDDLRYLTKTLV